ncbi:MAG: DEAD/DEAH box helicase [Spirochaetales bacterium]|jgi:DEAD/DEAH box helicase domain-containing protein|nr:DEAD/DEAH box helicase [Spirochaetales bacterium]
MEAKIEKILLSLETDRAFMDNVTRWEKIPAREGEFAPFPEGLHPRLAAALNARGIDKLYIHQARAFVTAREAQSFVVVTPTASGKSLCYNLPVLQSILEEPARRALYIFPTKALSQDQQADLNDAAVSGELGVKIATYDGDTPNSVRASARETGQIIISNPDMLHSGILPNHPKWIKFLKTLSWVVIDEVHSYRGVFGSHLANLLRRLKRIAAFYGSRPVFIFCSATIANPAELAQRILGDEKVRLIAENGAPSGEKHLVLYNPPLVDRVQGIRRGVVLESQRIALRLLCEGVKTIVFSRSRIQTELIGSYITAKLANLYNDNSRIRVESYRGGYLPNERREIEAGLRSGAIQGVVSTNALELGIDIGGLDAAVLAGFPGSISSSWQQAGRAGRRQGVSLAVMIASSSPLDQFMVKHPDYFFGRPPESGFIDPDNPYILSDHMRCAVFELPFGEDEAFGEDPLSVLEFLEEGGTVRKAGGAYHWADRSYPAEGVSLRSASSQNIVIIDITKGRNAVIGEMDRPSAKEMLFPNAVYLHRGRQFMVKDLNLEEKRAEVEEAKVNYYTDGIVKRDIKVLTRDSRVEDSECVYVLGDILVRSQVTKFKKIRYHSHENIGYGEIMLPEEEMHTRSLILVFEKTLRAGELFTLRTEEEKAQIICALGCLYRRIAPVFLLCDPRDIGVSERLRDPHFEAPAIYIFDQYPGGTGLADKFLEKIKDIRGAAAQLLLDCPCEEGCPSCIGPRDKTVEITGNPKKAITAFVRELE